MMKHSKANRPLIMGRNGMVSSGHHLASLAGVKVLREGGNAVDAALAASFTLAVVQPDACGVGGDLFALVYMKKNGKVEALNASGPAPKKATTELYREKGFKRVPTEGVFSIAVPGAVDGWAELHQRYGTFDLPRLASDAVGYAREGFPVSRQLANRIKELASFPWIEECYRRSLGDPQPGRVLAQKNLADTLERVMQKGRDLFYRGEIGARISAAIQKEGGLLSEEDLRGKQAEWLEPLSTSYRGRTVFEQPPVSQGFMVLEMLNIIEEYDPDKMAPADWLHTMIEAKKLAFEDRINHLEDPRFGDPKVGELISKEHARKRRALIAGQAQPRAHVAGAGGGDTTYLCASDREGNAVSIIQSVFAPFGSGVVAGDTGVVMNNRLSSFVLDPKRANALKPGKRPAHTLNSYMVFDRGEFFAVGGTPGNDDQPQSNLQILHQLLDRGLDPQSAIELPRWSHMPGTPPRDQLPEGLSVEDGFPPELIDGLKKKGHKVTVADRWSFGAVELIVHDPESGSWMAGADPRREGYAIGW